jgi:4-carboxymuconolactone decarboxylase
MDVRAEELLRGLTRGEDSSARIVMALNPSRSDGQVTGKLVLAPRVRTLVRLAALIAADASTTSLRWAVELACCAGADEDDIVRVLATVTPEVGFACVVATAPRLALAIGYEIDLGGGDGA